MTTYDYEMLDQPASELAEVVALYPNTVKSLDYDVLFALLGFAQHQQDHTIYDACTHELDRRNGIDTAKLRDEFNQITAGLEDMP